MMVSWIFPFVAEKVLNSKTIRSNSSGLSVGCGKETEMDLCR